MEKQCLISKKDTIWKYKISVEPMVVLYFSAITLSQNLQLNLLLNKACRVYDITESYCETETESELIVSKFNTWKLFFLSVFTVIFSLYAGLLIDRNPKCLRFLLFIPMIGQIFSDFGNYLSTYFWSWSLLVTGIYDALLVGLTGSSMGFTVLCLSYLSYTSNKKERTVKIGYFYSCFCMGLCCGSFLSGYVTIYLGYFYGFLLCIALDCTAMICGRKFIEDIDVEEEQIADKIIIVELIKSNWNIVTRKRNGQKRLIIILSLLAYPLAIGAPLGELSVLYLFLRHRFGWDAVQYGVYMSFKMIIKSAGTLFCTEILKRRLQLHDATIGIIGCSLSVLASIGWILIFYPWEVYAITLMGVFEKAIVAVIIALATKCVELHEYGQITSIFAMMYLVTPILYPLYNEVYENGIYTFPSSFFGISLILMTSCGMIFCILWYFTRKSYKVLEKNVILK